MARTSLTAATIAQAGTLSTLVTPDASGAQVLNDANGTKTFIAVNNGSGAPITVTLVATYSLLGLDLADQTITVAAGAMKLIGPFSKTVFNQPAGADAGKIFIDFSAVTSVTVGAFALP